METWYKYLQGTREQSKNMQWTLLFVSREQGNTLIWIYFIQILL